MILRHLIFILIIGLYYSIAEAGQFAVIRVYDGDTLLASGHDITIKVRLVGIDAPETSKGKRKSGQPFSQAAKKHLSKLVLGKTVDIRGYGLGRYNRVLGVVFADGVNINLEMIRSGMAEVYRGRPPKSLDMDPYWKAEREAKKRRIGIWSLKNYISPKEWRAKR